MEGITTFPTRLWLSLASQPAAATTPFLRATKTFPERRLPATYAPELFDLRDVLPYSVMPQLMACDPDNFLRAAELLPAGVTPAVELNCGCPSPNGAGLNAGSGILRDADAFGMTIDRLSRTLGPGRLAVKMRLGIDSPAEFDALLPHVARLPLARLTVHGRTRADKYRGKAKWDVIQQAAAASTTPTWASGDAVNAAGLNRLKATAPSIAGAMIGRGIMYNPWIFEELRRGEAVTINPATLANAIACYGMLHELWITASEKVVSRVGSGRISGSCGTDFAAWEKLCVQLSGMLGGAPFALFDARHVPDVPVSPTSYARVKLLWAHLRTSLPAEFASPRLVRAKSLGELLQGILAVGVTNDIQVMAH